MGYKASQESQEIEVKSLADRGSKNKDETTIDDKINSMNQDQNRKENIDSGKNNLKQNNLDKNSL